MAAEHRGLRELFTYPLMSAIFDRRTRRVARGTSIPSGPISYTSSNKPAPLTPLEEAVLIVSTGLTGAVTTARRAREERDGSDRFSAPLINILARSASSIDNAHAVSFFLINDEGTWLIKQHRNQRGAGHAEPVARRDGKTGRKPTGLPPPRASSTGCTRSASIFRATGPTTSSGTGSSRTALARRSFCRSSISRGRSSTSSSACCPRKTASGRCSSTTGANFVPGRFSTGARGSPVWSASFRRSRIRSSAARDGRGAAGSIPSTRRLSGSPTRCGPTTRRSSSFRT